MRKGGSIMVVLTGDTHGTDGLIQRLAEFRIDRGEIVPTVFIVLGDIGMIWDQNWTKHVAYVQRYIDDNLPQFTLAFLAGNHENFDALETLEVSKEWGGEVGIASKDIFHLLNGEIFTIEGKTYAVYGGALSIDKHRRKEGVSWWPQEITDSSKFYLLSENASKFDFRVDFLLTHTMANDEITLIDMFPFTDKLSDPVARDIRNIKRHLIIKDCHAFGHFHIDKIVPVGGHNLVALYRDFYIIE